MLYFYYSKIRENSVIKTLNGFLSTPWYMLLIALIMAASNIFGLEFMAFYAYMLMGIYIVLFAPDCFAIIPMFCCGYMLFSSGNNPAENYGETIFSKGTNLTQFIVIAVIIGVCLLTRFFFEILVVRRKVKRMPALTFGFVALGLAYLLSGVYTEGYGGKELAFSALQIVSLCVTYFYFYYTVDWEKRNVGDCAMMLSAVGVGLFLEIVGMYLHPEVIEAIKNGTFHRTMLLSGWGVYNNVGGMMAMLMPAPFYFACVKKRGWLYLLLASVFLGGIVLSQSRGAIIIGGVIYLVSCILTIVYTPKERKLANIVAVAIVILGFAVGVVVVLSDAGGMLLGDMIATGKNDNGRMDVYKAGIKQFFESPIFGKGFYAPFEDANRYPALFEHQYGFENLGEGYFIPPRYHNTLVQLLATGGVVALLAYAYHRAQTIALFVKKPSASKTFLGLAICAHLLASLLDCHFFNLGPGLTYGIILLCAEMLPRKERESAQELPTLPVEEKSVQ